MSWDQRELEQCQKVLQKLPKTILLDLLQRMKTLILRGEQRPEATGLQPVSQRVDKSDKPIPSVVGRAFSGWSI